VIVMLALLGFLFCGSINAPSQMVEVTQEIIVINDKMIVCCCCGEPACCLCEEAGELKGYCAKHMPLPEK
jgi:hypothetical protein